MIILFEDRPIFVFLGESDKGKQQKALFHLISLVGDIGKNSDEDYSRFAWLKNIEKKGGTGTKA